MYIVCYDPLIPPTDSMVCEPSVRADSNNVINSVSGLTKGDAVGPSRTASSSSVKGSRGTTYVLSGTNRKMIIGNPMAATHLHEPRGSET